MSHIGGAYGNITVVQRVTPALRVARRSGGGTESHTLVTSTAARTEWPARDVHDKFSS
ncbi:MAG TPA: hypothetical protein VHW72_19590 [Candidatus Angelobacter sp.]|nr:hypothetical protein [Candidatus Angelobacter sp.]